MKTTEKFWISRSFLFLLTPILVCFCSIFNDSSSHQLPDLDYFSKWRNKKSTICTVFWFTLILTSTSFFIWFSSLPPSPLYCSIFHVLLLSTFSLLFQNLKSSSLCMYGNLVALEQYQVQTPFYSHECLCACHPWVTNFVLDILSLYPSEMWNIGEGVDYKVSWGNSLGMMEMFYSLTVLLAIQLHTAAQTHQVYI